MLSIRDDPSPRTEAKIATEIVVAAHWIQRHEYAIKIDQGIYVTNQNTIITFDKPSTTIEFYLCRVPIHDPKLHLMGDLYLICQAKIGSLIQELTDKIRADFNHDLEKAVHYSGLDGRSRGRKVTIGCLLDVLKEKAETLIDFAPFVIGAMNKYYERERAMRVLEGLEDMTHPGLGFTTHQNVEPRIVSFCSKLSPFHIFAHLNEKHRVDSYREEKRLQSLFSKQAMEKAMADGDPEVPRRAVFAVFEAVRDGAGSSDEVAAYRDVSYFSDKNINSRYDHILPATAHKPSDSGYVSGATKEQLEEYNKLSSEKENMVAGQPVFTPDNAAPQNLYPQPEGQMTSSPTMQLRRLTEDVWAGYGCDRHMEREGNHGNEDKAFDWDALIERYPATASSHGGTADETFNWERVLDRAEQSQYFPGFIQYDNGYTHDNDETDRSPLSHGVGPFGYGDEVRTANHQDNQYDNGYIHDNNETNKSPLSHGVDPFAREDEARTANHQDNPDEDGSITDEETVLRRRAHTLALLEGKDENANALVTAWNEGRVGTAFLAGIYAPEEKKKAKKGFFGKFRNITR